MVALVFSSAIGLAFPLVVRYLMDAAFVTRNLYNLNAIALGLLGLFAIKGVLNFFEVYLLGATGEQVIARLRKNLFSHSAPRRCLKTHARQRARLPGVRPPKRRSA